VGRSDFDEFYETYFDRVARALVLAGADRESAWDATQEAFARALRRWRTVRDMERPDGWVYVVAMNLLRDRWRRDERHGAAPQQDTDNAADNTGGIATRLSVRDLIATLPPRQRQAIVLRYLADLPIGDVADAMGCALGTAKATIHQALQNLRVELDDQEAKEGDDDAHG
jgi:RNA polymerase sigma-70 factor (ECF subfamily)